MADYLQFEVSESGQEHFAPDQSYRSLSISCSAFASIWTTLLHTQAPDQHLGTKLGWGSVHLQVARPHTAHLPRQILRRLSVVIPHPVPTINLSDIFPGNLHIVAAGFCGTC